MASCTIAIWLKETLRLAGINVSILPGHSVRGASMSAAAAVGVTMNDIMQAADWSSEGFSTNPLMTLPMAGQCCLQPLVRPEQYCVVL